MIKEQEVLKCILANPNKTYLEIAREYGLKKSQVHYIAKKHKIPSRSRSAYWTPERRIEKGKAISKSWTHERRMKQREILKTAWNLILENKI